MSDTTTLAQGPVKGRRKSNSTSTNVSASESSGSGSGSGSGTGRKGKSKANKENWDDDFVFHRPPPKPQPRTTREPSPVPSFADSAIWGDDSDEDNDNTIKLSVPLSIPSTSLPSPITPPSETLGLISHEEAKGSIDEPARRLVKKQKQTQSSVKLRDDLSSHELHKIRPSSSSSSAALAAALRANDLTVAEDKQLANETGTTKGVGRTLLGKMSKRFSGTDDLSKDQALRRPRSSTNVKSITDANGPPSRSSSIRKSSSSFLRAVHPSASTSSLVTSVPPIPSYPSPPLTAHPSRGFHLPSPSPNSPYHSSSSLHGSGLLSSRSASGSSHQSESVPPLPTSTSYPILSNSMPLTEADESDPARTPRKKPRPQSVQVTKKPSLREAGLGLGLASENSWRPNWKGPTEASRKKSETSITFDTPLPTTPTLSKPQTALRRLGSLSKKHGRKLSGGWKFGSSTTLAEPPLPTVFASPAPNMRGESTSAPTSRILNASSTVRSVDPEEVNKAIESWASPDDELPVKKVDRRRNSWNDLSIPRSVLEKQKELKAGMSAVRRFAKGVESLKRMKEEYMLLGLGDGLDAEYAQWWEVADVLIEVGSTSTAADDESVKTPTKPSRERRVTLAASAGAGMPVRQGSAPARPTTPRASSDTVYHDAISDGEDGSGPPRASPPDHWRASTGRQDLSKRQLEVLRNMLTSPSTTSVTALPAVAAAPLSPIQSTPVTSPTGMSVRPPPTSTTLPSPSDSAFIVPSPALPPVAAAAPAAGSKKRRPSRIGLLPIRELIRSLRGNPRSPTDEIPSSPTRTRTPKERAAERSPPVSYMTTLSFSSEENGLYPTTRSSFSALGRTTATGTRSAPIQGRRPSVRAMFRSTATAQPSGKNTLLGTQGCKTPESPKDQEATLRPSNRRALSSISNNVETRSISAQSAPVDSRLDQAPLPQVIALTPENLGPLLEALQACVAKLDECLARNRVSSLLEQR